MGPDYICNVGHILWNSFIVGLKIQGLIGTIRFSIYSSLALNTQACLCSDVSTYLEERGLSGWLLKVILGTL